MNPFILIYYSVKASRATGAPGPIMMVKRVRRKQ
jgi:hypothetical protein